MIYTYFGKIKNENSISGSYSNESNLSVLILGRDIKLQNTI